MADLVRRRKAQVIAARIHAYAPDRPPPFGQRDLRDFWKSVSELGLAVQLHFEPRYAPGFEPLIREFTGTKVIIDHLGRPFQGTPKEHAAVIRWARYRNTIMKLSSLPEKQQYPHRDVGGVIKRLTHAFGPDRLIYGGGFGASATGKNRTAIPAVSFTFALRRIRVYGCWTKDGCPAHRWVDGRGVRPTYLDHLLLRGLFPRKGDDVMRCFRAAMAALLVLGLVSATALADQIKVSGVHNCCASCCKLIHQVLGKVEGVSEISAKPKQADFTFDAANRKAARRAIGALARAGFHGKTDKAKLNFPSNSGVKNGTATRLSLVGIHNCCPGCCKAAKQAIAKVKGVQADTLTPKKRRFVVEGNFDGAAVIKALNDAGFHARKEGATPRRKKKKTDN